MHDPRGNRIELGWFVAGREPRTFCDRHVLYEREIVNEAVPPTLDDEGEVKETEKELVGLLRIQRNLPIAIGIADAPYALPTEDEE